MLSNTQIDLDLVWVPGNPVDRSNEVAYELPRRGTVMGLVGPEPTIGLPLQLVKKKANDWVHNDAEVQSRVSSTHGPPSLDQITREGYRWYRARAIKVFLTEKNTLCKYLQIMGIVVDLHVHSVESLPCTCFITVTPRRDKDSKLSGRVHSLRKR